MPARPNVLFIICDDLNNAIAGMGRQPCAPAPNLQRLMQRGVRFTNAHNNCPICLASRNSLFSGLYAHRTGSYTLWDQCRTLTPLATTAEQDLPGWGRTVLNDTVWLPQHFQQHGYRVYGAGKVLHEGARNRDWWDEFAFAPDYGPYLGETLTARQQAMYASQAMSDYADRYEGSDRFFLNGRRYRHHIETGFGPLSELFGRYPAAAANRDGSPWRYVSDEDRDPLPDERVAEWGAEVLRRPHDEPFFLALGFMKPHTPLNAPQAYFDQFPLDQIQLPPQLAGDLDDCARALVDHRPYGFLLYQLIQTGGERWFREFLQAYLACVAFVDEMVGRVLDALEASPYADRTIVVFTSDNGYHLGEKEYIFKDSLWEESGQIPLLLAAPGPGAAGGECTAPVSLVDLYPTLCDLCGLDRSPHPELPLAGHSLRPLLESPAGGWDGPPVALTSVRGDTGIHHSVRSATHRYTRCGNGEEELYDHTTDPHEWHNLAGSPAHETVRLELREEMLKLLGRR